MKLKTKAWLASQFLLLLTAALIQLTFYKEIKLGPLLGTTKRPYWEIILDREPAVPDFVDRRQLPRKMWDPREALSEDELRRYNLVAHRRAFRREEGLRTAFYGGCLVNGLYFVVFHLLCWRISSQVSAHSKSRSVRPISSVQNQ